MKVVILCGGLGTRLSEETQKKPKPMVRVGKLPILHHIMNVYSQYGYNDFVIALGYKGNHIKKYFKNLNHKWKIQLVNTGQKTLTGGRILRLKKYLDSEENFMLTYGDGVADVNIDKLLKFHLTHKKLATITTVRPPVRFGELKLKKNKVISFKEKPQSSSGWINGGFFIFNKKIIKLIKNDQIMLEREPLELLSKKRQLLAFKHKGFWQCMDSKKDLDLLNSICKKKNIPWLKK